MTILAPKFKIKLKDLSPPTYFRGGASGVQCSWTTNASLATEFDAQWRWTNGAATVYMAKSATSNDVEGSSSRDTNWQSWTDGTPLQYGTGSLYLGYDGSNNAVLVSSSPPNLEAV